LLESAGSQTEPSAAFCAARVSGRSARSASLLFPTVPAAMPESAGL